MRDILGDAGFKGIEIDKVDRTMPVGRDLEQATALRHRIRPGGAAAVAGIFRVMQAKAVAAVREALAKHDQGKGMALPGACWLVQARN